MKRIIGGVAVGAMVVAFMVVMPVLGNGQKGEAACPCLYYAGCGALKDAKVEVQNTDKGVTISIAAETIEQVKAIQTTFADFGKGTNAPCYTVQTEDCRKAHASGECLYGPGTNRGCCSMMQQYKERFKNNKNGNPFIGE